MLSSRSYSIPVAEQGQNSGYQWSSPPSFPPGTMPEENASPGYCKLAVQSFGQLCAAAGDTPCPPPKPETHHVPPHPPQHLPSAQSHKFIHWIWMKRSALLTGMTCVNLQPFKALTNFSLSVVICICKLLKQSPRYMENIWFQQCYSFMKACFFQVSFSCTLSLFVVQNAYFYNYFSSFPQLFT